MTRRPSDPFRLAVAETSDIHRLAVDAAAHIVAECPALSGGSHARVDRSKATPRGGGCGNSAVHRVARGTRTVQLPEACIRRRERGSDRRPSRGGAPPAPELGDDRETP